MSDLPKDRSKSFRVNGVLYADRDEYEKRIEEDAMKLATLIYDIYMDKKAQEINEQNNG